MMRIAMIFCILFLLCFTLAADISAQQSDYRLWKDAIHTGGEVTAGGTYQLQATVGQANVGVLSGGSYQLTSGFWHPVDRGTAVYLPIVQR